MSFKPRYSLLTLFVLTALVAGGVKLWYGPHRVVEQVVPGMEDEYAFVRNWRGNKQRHGAHIRRTSDDKGQPSYTDITFYRIGKQTGHFQVLKKLQPGEEYEFFDERLEFLSLSQNEEQEFQAAITHEIERIRHFGFDVGITKTEYFKVE